MFYDTEMTFDLPMPKWALRENNNNLQYLHSEILIIAFQILLQILTWTLTRPGVSNLYNPKIQICFFSVWLIQTCLHDMNVKWPLEKKKDNFW